MWSMLTENTLPKILRKARAMRGWSIHQASNRMLDVLPNTLRTLEGLNPDRNPACAECKLKTVLEIIRVYWPDVTLEDFAQRELLIKVVPKNAKANRRLKGFLADTG